RRRPPLPNSRSPRSTASPPTSRLAPTAISGGAGDQGGEDSASELPQGRGGDRADGRGAQLDAGVREAAEQEREGRRQERERHGMTGHEHGDRLHPSDLEDLLDQPRAPHGGDDPKYTAIYSGFAVVILSLIWLQVAWLIVLVGGQVAYADQHPSSY